MVKKLNLILILVGISMIFVNVKMVKKVYCWEKTYGEWGDDVAYSIQQTRDGGYIVAGRTESKGAGRRDFWVLKLDEKGKIIWDNTYGGSEDDVANSIQQTRDGGYIVAGRTESKGAGGGDFWVLKLNEKGKIEK